MKFRIIILFAAFALVWAADANAHLMVKRHCTTIKCINARQLQNLKHARYVCHHGRHQTKRWNCAAVKWLTREYKQTEAVVHPRVVTPAVDSCLNELIQRESGWNVRATNPSTGAYGLPQALPGSKMASAGADWATNPATQIRWMQGYVAHYGGSCGALAFQKTHGWY